MIRRDNKKVTFVLTPNGHGAVSVVGDFNQWNPAAHPMRKRSNGTISVAVPLGPGRYRFRYLGQDGAFFDDDDADVLEPNGFGDTHSVLVC